MTNMLKKGEELWIEVMDDYVTTVSMGYLALDQKKYKAELREHFNKLLSWHHKQQLLLIDEVVKICDAGKKKVIPNMLQDDNIFQECGMDGVNGYNAALNNLKQKLLAMKNEND